VFVRLRNYIVTGAVVLVPVVLTWYVMVSLFEFLDGLTARWVVQWIGYEIPGLGLLVTVGIVLLTGMLTRSFLGRRVISFGQSMIAGVPIVRGVYTTIRQIVDAFAITDQKAFMRAALIEYPRKDIWSIAFLTSTSMDLVSECAGTGMVAVFLPTTPNPTSGYLLFVPPRDVRLLDISVEDALKLVISGGIVGPPAPREERAAGRAEQKAPPQVEP